MIFIAVSQQRVVGSYIVDEVACTLRQIDIIYVDGAPRMASLPVTLAPLVAESGGGDDTGILRTLLVIHSHVYLRRGLDTTLEVR